MEPGGRKTLINWLQIGLIIGSLALMYHDSLLTHMRNLSDPLHQSEDARQQIWPLLRYYDPSLFTEDYIADYYLRCILPAGYRALYRTGAMFWDPRAMSKVLPYPLLLVVVAALGLAAHRLGGKAAAWSAMALGLSTGVFLERMTGGLPRSFGYPLIACAAVALVYGRPFLLSVVVVMGAAFYPVAGLIAGFALAAFLLLLPGKYRGQAAAWPFRKCLLVVVATVLVSGIVLLPNVLSFRTCGPMVGPAHDEEFPEVGGGGRYGSRDRAEGHGFLKASWVTLSETFQGAGDPWSAVLTGLSESSREPILLGVLALILGGAVVLAWREAAARRLVILLAVAVVGHSLAKIAAPFLYLPDRYVVYPIPILALILLPASIGALAVSLPWFGQRPWSKPACTLLVCGLILVVQGGRGPEEEGIRLRGQQHKEILHELHTLPRDAMIAGWPRGTMDYVPYFAERRVLVTRETHQALHRNYTLEMRRRVMATMDAYYATDVTPLVRLRDEFRVTHLLVNREHFGEKPPKYFHPFKDRLRELQARVKQSDLEVLRQIHSAAVYDRDEYFLLDLRRLKTGAATDIPGAPATGRPSTS